MKMPKIVALTTCSTEFTDARTIVLTYATDYYETMANEEDA